MKKLKRWKWKWKKWIKKFLRWLRRKKGGNMTLEEFNQQLRDDIIFRCTRGQRNFKDGFWKSWAVPNPDEPFTNRVFFDRWTSSGIWDQSFQRFATEEAAISQWQGTVQNFIAAQPNSGWFCFKIVPNIGYSANRQRGNRGVLKRTSVFAQMLWSPVELFNPNLPFDDD